MGLEDNLIQAPQQALAASPPGVPLQCGRLWYNDRAALEGALPVTSRPGRYIQGVQGTRRALLALLLSGVTLEAKKNLGGASPNTAVTPHKELLSTCCWRL